MICTTTVEISKFVLPHGPSQGSYGSWKNWKVMEFCFLAFQAWKVMEFCVELWKVMENLNSIKKNYESVFIVYHNRQKFHWMYFTELWKKRKKSWKIMEFFCNLKSTNPASATQRVNIGPWNQFLTLTLCIADVLICVSSVGFTLVAICVLTGSMGHVLVLHQR